MTDAPPERNFYTNPILAIPAIAFIVVLIFAICTITAPLDEANHKTAVITVTDKQTLGESQMQIFAGSDEYRAPGYMWNDVVVGGVYNISYIENPFLSNWGNWITSISRVDNEG